MTFSPSYFFPDIYSLSFLPLRFLKVISSPSFSIHHFFPVISSYSFLPCISSLSFLPCHFFPVISSLSFPPCHFFPVISSLSFISCYFSSYLFPAIYSLLFLPYYLFPVIFPLPFLMCYFFLFMIPAFSVILSPLFLSDCFFPVILAHYFFHVNCHLNINSSSYFSCMTMYSLRTLVAPSNPVQITSSCQHACRQVEPLYLLLLFFDKIKSQL